MKEKYKSLQGTIKLWCCVNWGSCDIICANETAISSADVIVVNKDERVGFIFVLDKEIEFLKQQVINCKKSCSKIYLITSELELEDLRKVDNTINVLKITDKYGFGYTVEKL